MKPLHVLASILLGACIASPTDTPTTDEAPAGVPDGTTGTSVRLRKQRAHLVALGWLGV